MNFLITCGLPIVIGVGVIAAILLITYKLGDLASKTETDPMAKPQDTGDKIGIGFIIIIAVSIALFICYLIGKLFLWIFPIL